MTSLRRCCAACSCLLALTLSLAALPSVARAASLPDGTRCYWASLGSGLGTATGGFAGSTGTGPGFCADLELATSKGRSVYTCRLTGMTALELDFGGEPGSAEAVWDLGLLYGRVAKSAGGFASLSAGLALTGVSAYDEHGESVDTLHPGLPLEAQAFWTPSAVLGFGLRGFANLNAEKSFAGLLLSVQVGRLR